MATKTKRKSSTKKRSSGAAKSTKRKTQRRNPVNPVNPVRASSKKRSGRSKRTRTRRSYRNPLMSGAAGEVLSFAGAGLGLGIFQPIVSNAVGSFLPFGQYNGPLLTFGSGWLLSWVFKLLPFTRPLSRPTFILGASTAVIQVTQPIVRNLIGNGGAAAPPLMQGPRGYYRRGQGMGAIGAVTGTPPHLVPLPPPPPANGARKNGMGAIGAVPGRFAR